MSIDKFIDELNLDIAYSALLASMLASQSSYYRQFQLRKKRGGFRIINVPYPSLDILQKKIHLYLKERFKPSESVYAYVLGKNAIEHAKQHVNSKELLTLDIIDFFGSITSKRILAGLINTGINSSIASIITSLCCLNDKIPQGSSASPILSNIIFYPIDKRLHSLATKFNLVYSRYADDLVFSGESIPNKLKSYVHEILKEYDFIINEEKTKLKKENSKKIITGVSITNGIMKCPKKFKRELRKEIFILEKNISNLSMIKPLDPLIYERTLGKINYLLQIEPSNDFYKKKKEAISKHHQKFLKM